MRLRLFSILLTGVTVSLASASGFVVMSTENSIRYLVMHENSGTWVTSALDLGTVPSEGRILAANDFDANGSVDLVLEYDPDGAGPRPMGTFLWRFSGETRIGVTQLGGVAGGYTVPVGVSDLDHDGSFEVMMANPSNRSVRAMEVLANAPYAGGIRTILLGGVKDTVSMPVAVGDIDLDGNDDEILQDPVSGAVAIRYMSGSSSRFVRTVNFFDIAPGRLAGVINPLHNSGSVKGFSGFIIDSPDGIQPRQYIQLNHNTAAAQDLRLEVTGDEAYRSWPIVAVVP